MALPPTSELEKRTGVGLIIRDDDRSYYFKRLTPTALHGTEFEGETAHVYVGKEGSKHYITSHDLSEVPKPYIETIVERTTLLDNVDGGWKNWEGRPELSESYIDLSDATIVSLDDATETNSGP